MMKIAMMEMTTTTATTALATIAINSVEEGYWEEDREDTQSDVVIPNRV